MLVLIAVRLTAVQVAPAVQVAEILAVLHAQRGRRVKVVAPHDVLTIALDPAKVNAR